jgi:hypothetical protein
MKNIKLYLIIGAALLLISGVVLIQVQRNTIIKLRNENTRLDSNQTQLLADLQKQIILNLKESEVTGRLKFQRDSLAEVLKIRPKQITEIVTINNVVHDTIKKEIPVNVIARDYWSISDTGKCFKYSADIYYNQQADSMLVWRTNYEDFNTTTQVFYRKRPHKFWFIHYGKWQYLQSIKSKCGEPSIKTINFIK